MKVLICQKIAGISGSELYIKNLLLALNKINIEAHFLAIEPENYFHLNDDFIHELSDNKIKYFRISYSHPFSYRLLRDINNIIKNGKYDVIQTNLIHADIIISIIKLIFDSKIKILSVKHGYDEKFQSLYGLNPDYLKKDKFYYLTKFASKFINYHITVSDSLTNFIIKTQKIHPQKISTIPLGFDFSQIHYDASVSQYKLSENQLVIIGRLVPVKQHNLVLQILPDIIKEFPDLQLVIVGDGSHRQELELQCQVLNLQNHVTFTGFSTHIHDYLKNSVIEILPSSAEGFGIVILEAWHSEVPIIAFDVPAPNEIISDGIDGYLVPPFDINILKDKIIYLLHNKEIAHQMGKAGKAKLESQYTMEIMLNRTIDMYNKVLLEE